MNKLRSSGFNFARKYSDPSLHGKKNISNHMAEILLELLPKKGKLLDVGCGDAEKLIPIAEAGIQVLGIDVSQGLLEKAAENIHNYGLSSITIKEGSTDKLPIDDSSVDCVSFMMAPHNASEAFRVLKPGGYVVRERVGFGDKSNIKEPFKNPDGSPRGYQSDIKSEEELKNLLTKDFARAGFVDIKFEVIEIETNYTPDGLRLLLKETPTIENYDENKDRTIVNQLINSQVDSGGRIKSIQRRLILIAVKPNK
ncbi:methyltransferase domain-containing protein [Candidatus Dojkabacteria bacterium]|jgi:SAM-dependent methyltransferase|uniref:Methyltransferase domain-containing protein n=1 Tax=Candidatus Dojkabacteria bacterium TaxID=2099670 RepID=A0A955I928_9BACT|nr:methyltransferase domain-containing protein [Candidatus Dojkabacteria bacterium]